MSGRICSCTGRLAGLLLLGIRNCDRRGTLRSAAVPLSVFLLAQVLYGAVYVVSPGEDLRSRVNALQPGDTLQLHGGTYDVPSGIKFNNKAGTAIDPVVMEAVTGETPVLNNTASSGVNLIEINDSSHVAIRGLELTGGPAGSDGIKGSFNMHNSHITIEDCHIHHVPGTAINSKGTDDNNWIVRGNEIHHTGGIGTGIGFGIIDSATVITRDSVVEFNYIHDTGGTNGGGIEVNGASHNNILRHNVICRTKYPGIKLREGMTGNPNVVEGNAIWGTTDDAGIEAESNVIIRNNIVFNCYAYSINIWGSVHDVSIVNNSVYECAIRIGTGGTGLLVANNACYAESPSDTVFVCSGGVEGEGNVHHGQVLGFPPGWTEGNAPAIDMIGPASADFWPGATGALVEAASAVYAPNSDFNGMPRPFGLYPDAGAYEWSADTNPGWVIGESTKNLAPGAPDMQPPRVSLAEVVLTGTASDAGGIQPSVWVDGVPYPLISGSFTTPPLSVYNGRILSILAKDIAANEALVTVSIQTSR